MKSKTLRWLGALLALAAVATVAVIATLFWVWLAQYDRAPVPLTNGLKGDRAVMSKAFDDRVRITFPIGTSEQRLTRVLKAQGFHQVDWGGQTGAEHEAVRREDGVACNIGARIYWRSDQSGRLREIRGHYGEEGCL